MSKTLENENDNTTIWVLKKTRDKLRDAEEYPNEPFDSIINRLLKPRKED